jgi:hypothetical protein
MHGVRCTPVASTPPPTDHPSPHPVQGALSDAASPCHCPCFVLVCQFLASVPGVRITDTVVDGFHVRFTSDLANVAKFMKV